MAFHLPNEAESQRRFTKSVRHKTLRMAAFYAAAKLVKNRNWQRQLLEISKNPGIPRIGDYDLVVHEGALLIEGNFSMIDSGIKVLIVNGDLTVTGTFAAEEKFNNEYFVVVVGNMRAHNLLIQHNPTMGGAANTHVEVQGHLVVADTLWASGSEAEIGGDVTARLLLADYFSLAIEGRITYELAVGGTYSQSAHTCTKFAALTDERTVALLAEKLFTPTSKWDFFSEEEQLKITEAGKKNTYFAFDERVFRTQLFTNESVFKCPQYFQSPA